MALINLNPAYDKARPEFAGVQPEEAARCANVHYCPETQMFQVPFMGKEYRVHYPDGEITTTDGKEIPLVYRVCLLHYLVRTKDVGLTGEYLTFKELPNGSIYIEPFKNRAIRPLVSLFGQKPELMVVAGKKMGGSEVEMGDRAVKVPVFPKVPITFVIWEGDEEFPPAGNILYDSSAAFHLDTEDYALLPGLVISEMKKQAGM